MDALEFNSLPLDVPLALVWKLPCCDWSVCLSHLSMTCLSRPWVHPSCPGVLVSLKPNKKTFLYSSASSLSYSHSPHSLSVSPSVSFRPPAFDKRITLLFIQGDWCC